MQLHDELGKKRAAFDAARPANETRRSKRKVPEALASTSVWRFEPVREIVDGPCSNFSNSAENREKTFLATLLAEPFPGTVAQGLILVFAKKFSGL